MNEYVIAALVFGLTAGFQPGPLGIIIIQQTLEYGLKSGIKASLAPIITDGPIILATVLVLTQLKDISFSIGILSLIGGIYLCWLAFKVFNMEKMSTIKDASSAKSLSTAIKVNLLNPNPYLFWFTVGGTYIVQGTKAESITFVVVSIGTLVLSKMLIAFVASNFRELLNSQAYTNVMRVLALLLLIFGLLFLSRSTNILF